MNAINIYFITVSGNNQNNVNGDNNIYIQIPKSERKDKIIMNMKDIFDPNNYAEKAMPVSTSLCRALEFSGLDMMSDETKKITEEHSKLDDEFF